ncbi:MAG: carbamoyltransferase HypF [Chitinispirillaceae bacterium]|nr:carbamoyltransferase HypF [Chitinispirillaceae bacterium]
MRDSRTVRIFITGLVQGIGFRPFIYNLAGRFGIRGYVRNGANAVEVLAGGTGNALDEFIRNIETSPPPLARIDSIRHEEAGEAPGAGFQILQSEDTTDEVTDVSPDIAVCDYCLADMKTQPHRIDYPLINCTLCGPRFSIIRSVPYDRLRTTMAPFAMCETCAGEYTDPADRRFHAQPVACNDCGPKYSLYGPVKTVEGNERVVAETARLIGDGAVVAVKGTGGFHFACNPFSDVALQRLRTGKRRDGKPFALMFRDIETLRNYAEVNDEEEKLLHSTIRPVVLLAAGGTESLLPDVNNRLSTVGAMLPYMPFHHLLFEKTALPAIVMTSGNISEEPIVIDNETARSTFAGIADAVVIYNREIHNRVDDSVCAVFDGSVQILRRSRGFAPSPIPLNVPVDGIAAAGAELKNCFALGKGSKAILSQHIGDLKNSETMDFYREAFERLCTLFRVQPRLIAHDLHPDYLSTAFARETGLPMAGVQHHHAHIAACCAENGISGKVIGVALDGTGYGTDGAVWGGEFLLSDFSGFDRVTHIRYTGMPGGDRAAVEPWRMAASWLFECDGNDLSHYRDEFFPSIPEEHFNLIGAALEKNINTPRTSSAGRLFDAVAALCGLCDEMSFEAEAAMRLEAQCGNPLAETPYKWNSSDKIDLRETIQSIVADRRRGVDIGTISTRFHATIIDVIVTTCRSIRNNSGCGKVVLSGGCFQNRCIFEGTVRMLQENTFTVFTHHQIPCNDGGVALGQLVVAAVSGR